MHISLSCHKRHFGGTKTYSRIFHLHDTFNKKCHVKNTVIVPRGKLLIILQMADSYVVKNKLQYLICRNYMKGLDTQNWKKGKDPNILDRPTNSLMILVPTTFPYTSHISRKSARTFCTLLLTNVCKQIGTNMHSLYTTNKVYTS